MLNINLKFAGRILHGRKSRVGCMEVAEARRFPDKSKKIKRGAQSEEEKGKEVISDFVHYLHYTLRLVQTRLYNTYQWIWNL